MRFALCVAKWLMVGLAALDPPYQYYQAMSRVPSTAKSLSLGGVPGLRYNVHLAL